MAGLASLQRAELALAQYMDTMYAERRPSRSTWTPCTMLRCGVCRLDTRDGGAASDVCSRAGASARHASIHSSPILGRASDERMKAVLKPPAFSESCAAAWQWSDLSKPGNDC
eukprot:1142658-Pelagomonas_calceolata.AAC.2